MHSCLFDLDPHIIFEKLSLANFLHQYLLEEGVAIIDLAIFEGLDHRIHDRSNGLNANLEGHIVWECCMITESAE